ncbi:ribosomal protein L1, partial [Fistulina hepatica ATCC 64428]
MTAQALMDGHVASEVAEKAIEALHAHASKRDHARNTNELLPDKPQNVWLNITTKQMTAVHSFKPIKIPVAHPIIDPRTTGICLITKDPQREYKDLLEKNNVKFISRVVGVGKLKGKFKPYEARRMLLKDHGLFLADERVVPLLPKLLGSKWFDAKKQPLPVNLVRKNVKAELERAVSSTYMNRNQGTCTSVKLATLAQTPAQILENLKAALPAIAKHIPGGWDNIQALHIKTNASASLPIWTCSLNDEEGGRWDGMAAAPSDKEDKNAVSDVDIEDVAIEKGKKKRASADDEPGQPRKKYKATK